ncbi:hypothetical protein [Bradyrhizobium niftali]|uniref:Uncharacterized protein n=1 Tax=Bradyrhizobium niftali TaxID=2560055 RepID=A0A4Y9LLT9_9BRAD|nr:hypothetical protein [Bradyrhizobium niftali]TFV44518.1 hypothetical protein E4K65_27975 [Bradyrhizobium niftali]
MLKKSLLTMSLLLPLAAVSATAHAGSTITDKSYWPNEAGRSAQSPVYAQDPGRSAIVYDRRARVVAPAIGAIEDRPASRYQGGPKGH